MGGRAIRSTGAVGIRTDYVDRHPRFCPVQARGELSSGRSPRGYQHLGFYRLT